MLLDGKVAIVTGSSRGLGRAFALALSKEGAAVVVNGTNPALTEATEQAIKEAGGQATSVVGSVAVEDVSRRLVEEALQNYGRLDILVNNAGIVRDRTLLKMTTEEFDEVIAVNLRGSWLCSRHAALAMKDQGGGKIINIISNTGLTGGFGQGNYAASKGGLISLTFSMALELERLNIKTNAVWPIAQTDMTEVVMQRVWKSADDANRPRPEPAEFGFGAPYAVAPLIVFLSSDAASALNGQIITFNGRRLALWTHPHERNTLLKPSWTARDIAQNLSARVPHQEPVGYQMPERWG
jgi:NAD(P)-dependent dehydrogenase (short-subunit alcohol dehydrogenase family)